MYFISKHGEIYQGDMQIGDRVATEKEVTDHFAYQELRSKLQEADLFLAKSDKKVMPYYDFDEGDESLEWYVEKRKEARAFIRANR